MSTHLFHKLSGIILNLPHNWSYSGWILGSCCVNTWLCLLSLPWISRTYLQIFVLYKASCRSLWCILSSCHRCHYKCITSACNPLGCQANPRSGVLQQLPPLQVEKNNLILSVRQVWMVCILLLMYIQILCDLVHDINNSGHNRLNKDYTNSKKSLLNNERCLRWIACEQHVWDESTCMSSLMVKTVVRPFKPLWPAARGVVLWSCRNNEMDSSWSRYRICI